MKWRCVGKGGKAAERAGAEGRGTQVGCSMRAGGLLLFSLIPHLLGGRNRSPDVSLGALQHVPGGEGLSLLQATARSGGWVTGGDCPGADTWG